MQVPTGKQTGGQGTANDFPYIYRKTNAPATFPKYDTLTPEDIKRRDDDGSCNISPDCGVASQVLRGDGNHHKNSNSHTGPRTNYGTDTNGHSCHCSRWRPQEWKPPRSGSTLSHAAQCVRPVAGDKQDGSPPGTRW